MNFKVGDTVKVIRKPSKDELDIWYNTWIDSMDGYIGNTYTIYQINEAYNECQFDDASYSYSFPFCSLLKVENVEDPINPIDSIDSRYRYSRGIKYQYLHNGDYEHDDLCIGVLTHIIRDKDENAIVKWAVTYKNPKDKFSKQLARQVLSSRVLGTFPIKSRYTRDDILLYILTELYKSNNTPTHYRKFVLENMRRLLNYGNIREFL